MRQLVYKKRQSLRNRRKGIAIHEFSEDKDCKTQVRKNFAYKVTRVEQVEGPGERPQIFILKEFNTQTKEEKFTFRVRGDFFLTRDRYVFKVEFCHTLRIGIHWKKNIFSPKKSVTLT